MSAACNVHYSTVWSNADKIPQKSRPLTNEEIAMASGSLTTGLLFWPAIITGFIFGGPVGSAVGIASVSALGAGIGALVYNFSGKDGQEKQEIEEK